MISIAPLVSTPLRKQVGLNRPWLRDHVDSLPSEASELVKICLQGQFRLQCKLAPWLTM